MRQSIYNIVYLAGPQQQTRPTLLQRADRTDRRTDGRTTYRYTTLTVPRSRYRAVGSETISRGHGGPVDGTATRRMLLKSELHHPANIVENMAVVAASFDGNTAAARLTGGLISVHWLRARERARFKTAVLMYKACTHGTESAGSCRRSAHCLPLITRSLLRVSYSPPILGGSASNFIQPARCAATVQLAICSATVSYLFFCLYFQRFISDQLSQPFTRPTFTKCAWLVELWLM